MLRRKRTRWLEDEDGLSALRTVKLRCDHPVDTLSMDSKHITLESDKGGMTLFGRHNLTYKLSRPERIRYGK